MNPVVPVKPAELRKARICLLINALACPGLGSMVARRWGVGLCQLLLALAGAAGIIYALTRYLLAMLQLNPGHMVDTAEYWNAGIGSVLVFIASWFWSILTGVTLVREARRAEAIATPAVQK